MPHDRKSKTLSGELHRLLFSPKGGIEGLLLNVGAETIQVSMAPGSIDARVLAAAVGKPVEVQAAAAHSPKTKQAAHPVYDLDRITVLAGEAFESTDDAPSVSGIVSAIHYAKHGEPNGVILETGEFIHTRPPGMKKLKLKAGSKVVARGELRMTVLGNPLIEADEVNRVLLD